MQQWMIDHKQPAFRAKQLYSWLYQHLVTDFAAMSNLPQSLREQ